VRRPRRRRRDGHTRHRVRDVRRARALLPLRRRLDRTALARRLRLLRSRARNGARRRPRRGNADRQHPARRRRGPGERPRLPAARGHRALRWAARARHRVRGTARPRVARARAGAPPAARPALDDCCAGDDRQVLRAPAAHRERARPCLQRPSLAAPVGEGPRPRPLAHPGRGMRPERPRAGSDPGHVSVGGGGLAGLAAAVELADAGADVTLYESRARLGGATFSFERNGLWLDNGQHVALRCCTAYLDFLRRIGSDQLLPLQRRLNVPVLREGRPAALISRIGAPAPLHLAPSLLTYAPLSLQERAAAVRGALALKRLDPAAAALDAPGFGDWLRSHGQTANAITALWNLIALPTLNLPADEASLAAAVKVFRTGLLDSADAADIGIPAASFQQLHADPAQAAIEERGGRVLLSSPVPPADLDQ